MEKEPQTFEELGEVGLLKKQLAETRKQLRESAVLSAGERAVVNALEELIPARKEVPPAKLRKLGGGVMKMGGILDLGDWHYGEVISARSTGNVAQYSPEIARKRFDYTIEEATRLGKFYRISDIHVILGGDMISGNIHDDLNRNNEMMTIAQTLESSEMVYNGLEKLCQGYEQVTVYGVSGNHPRTERIPFYNHKQTENLDYMLYMILKEKGKHQPNLNFAIPESFWTIFDVEGRGFLTMHGDTNKQQNSMGISFYSVEREMRKWKGMAGDGTIPHYNDLITHHLHTAAAIPIGESMVYINGSGKGMDDYSLAGARPPSPPQQRYLAVGEGRVQADHLINLSHIGKP